MAAPWEDVRDVLVRVGFGSPRPSTSSDDIIRVTRGTGRLRGRDDDGQREKDASASSSRRRKRNRRTSNVDTNSPMASMLDVGDASTPLPRAAGRDSSTPADRQVRISTTAMSSRARNRARGVRPVHQSPSQLLLDLSPAIGDADGARRQDSIVNRGDGGDETAAALFAEALSPIVPIPSRTSSMAALSDDGEQTNGSDVDLSEVHDMVDQIQRDLTEDLKEISTSINNYDDSNNTNIANGDKNGDDGGHGSINKAGGGQEGGTNGPKAVSCAIDEPSAKSSTSAGANSTGDGFEAETSATSQEAEAHQSAETLEATPPANEKTEHLPLMSSRCTCDCHKKPPPQNDVVKAEKAQAMTPPKYKYPIPTRESADAPARALCQTADEIHCRAEVAGVLSCMITDVEQAHWLTTNLRHRSEITCLQNQLESAQRILTERRLVEQSEQERRKALGDHLLVNLMSMGTRLADAESYKIEMGELASENKRLSSQLGSALDQIKKVEAERDDALAAALKDRTLVEIEEMKKKGKKEQNTNVDEDCVSLKNGSKPLELVEVQMPNTKEGGTSVGEPPQRVKSTDFGVLVVKDQQRDHQDMEAKSGASDDKEEQLPPLLVLPERGLMVLFSFLEAEETLSVAELNMLMYSRVDALFGLGGEASSREEGTGTGTEINQESDETHERQFSAPTIVEVPPHPSGPDEGAGPGRPIEPREAAPRIGLAGQAQEGAHLIGSAVGNAVSNLLWQRNLQRERVASNNGSASSQPTKEQKEISEDDAARLSPDAAAAVLVNVGSDAASTTNHQSSPPLLTAGLASKIASKLSPQELAVIIQMRAKINQLEEELVKGKERQDDLMAELRGIEGVKDFLVSKLRDAEKSKSTKIDDAERTAKQVSSDQEVIGFLDNKVGELEMHCARLSTEREQLKKELTAMRKEGKVRFLEDQIKLMRDEVADQGKQWKMEKKVLVKEVKENRHKLAVFEAEKRGMQSELTRLKRELSSSLGHAIRSPKM